MSSQSDNMLFLMELSVLQSKLDKRLSLALSIHGVSLSEFMVLHQLANAPDHCLSRVVLASAVHLTASGVTRLLNPLEKLHIVEKQKNSRDARVSLVHLTEVGLETYVNAKQTYSETADALLDKVDTNELSEMLNSMRVAI
ncbi:MarR family winged helix-turn-helix transcriptional regulator [Arenicella xantha]|uniref:MarR family transcriptional regulator n=1 Tax=Arenicella xantha TaxID=644221 RepID=A0A395JL82_9GAMM|nr:MarR family transcriptional regulator [Arenicella xantha]RBP49728.1 MarR family transcriptional regulator [Arenicella xantha]